jgi:hypothetical protein
MRPEGNIDAPAKRFREPAEWGALGDRMLIRFPDELGACSVLLGASRDSIYER